MPSITDEERRERLAERHFLAVRGPSLVGVADGLVGLHATDPASVFMSAWARLDELTRDVVEEALYESRTLAKVLGMRRTMFVVPPDLAAVVDRACTQALYAGERRKLERMVAEQGLVTDAGAWVDGVVADVLRVLGEHGELTAVQIGKLVPDFGRTLRFGEGRKWAADVGVSTRVLFLMSTGLQIVRARPLGSWLSSQYRWAATTDWLGQLPAISPADARAQLARRYLATFGPATRSDLAWWTGWPLGQTDAALAAVDAQSVRLDSGTTGFVLPADAGPSGEAKRRRAKSSSHWVALLPSLDPTVMGWKERDWYLGGYRHALFDPYGNAGPTVWYDGRIVGGWGQNGAGTVVFELFEDVPSSARRAIAARAAALQEWLGGTKVTPRFRTPFEKSLAGA